MIEILDRFLVDVFAPWPRSNYLKRKRGSLKIQ